MSIETYCDNCDVQFNANVNYYVCMLDMEREVWCSKCLEGFSVLPPEVYRENKNIIS